MSSEELRQKGNEFYKRGDLVKALSLYQQAAEAAPIDAAPLRNISATYYELGDYSACAEVSGKALEIEGDRTSPQVPKLILRSARALLYLHQYDKAKVLLSDGCGAGEDSKELLAAIEVMMKSKTANTLGTAAARSKMISGLPKLKEVMTDVFEYYSVGHDEPDTLFKTNMKGAIKRGRSAFFMGGIGDGRHLYTTLMTLSGYEVQQGEKASEKKYHFTINDLKPHAIARDLLVLMILEEIAQAFPKSCALGKSEELFSTVYYIFIAPCMPAYAYEILQGKITKLLDALQGNEALPAAFDVPMMYRASLIKVLGRNNERGPALAGIPHSSKTPAHCKKEEHFYMNTGILMPPPSLARLHTKKEYDTYATYRPSTNKRVDRAVLHHVDSNWKPKNWKPNITMIDLEWERVRVDDDLDVNHDPFEFAAASYWTIEKPTGLYDVMRDFFRNAVAAIYSLRGRITIEAIAGDVTTVLEQIRWGLVGHRSQGKSVEDTDGMSLDKLEITTRNEYPSAYDCVHLSNIPDYIGGTIPIVLYALPIVFREPGSYVTFNCLRNTPRFGSHAHYNNEYAAGLSKPTDLEKTFQARLGKHDFDYLADYTSWYHSETPIRHLQELMPRTQLETWLYRFFLKTAIPYPRNPHNFALIYSPLNLTAVFRVCELLHEAGYPAHWLSGVLSAIMSGSITTTARPPRSEPLTLKEVKTIMPERTQSTRQFAAEMSTLATIWSTFSSFPIFSSQIPPIETIRQYRVRFDDDYPHPSNVVPTFVLVFMDMTKIADPGTLHTWLLDDELARRDKMAEQGRRGAMHVLTTWQYDCDERTAQFWLAKDVMGKMKQGMWAVQIWRSDVYMPWTPHRVVGEDVEDTGKFWIADA